MTYRVHYFVIILTIIVGIGLSILAFSILKKQDYERRQIIFQDTADYLSHRLEAEIAFDLDAVDSLKAFYLSNQDVTRSAFSNFAKGLIFKRPSVQALEWKPRISDSERVFYEQRAQREGFPDFQITESNVQGDIIRSSRYEEYFPVYFIEPYRGNEAALGFDRSAYSELQAAMDLARDTGNVVASQRTELVQETRNQDSFLVYAPIYRKGNPVSNIEERRDNIQGFVAGIFHAGDIVERALSSISPVGLICHIYDLSAPKEKQLLYTMQNQNSQETATEHYGEKPVYGASFKYARTIYIAGRDWSIVFTVTPFYKGLERSWYPWGILGFGVLVTVLLAGYLFGSVHHMGALSDTNSRLVHEVRHRTNAEEALRESEEKFRSISSSAQDAIVMMDHEGNISYWNEAAERMFGHSQSEIMGKPLHDTIVPQEYYQSFLKGFAGFKVNGTGGAIGKTVQLSGLRKDGAQFPVELSLSAVNIRGQWHAVCIIRDTTERKRLEEKLSSLSITDELTGLYNRRGFFVLAEQQLKIAERSKKKALIFFADLDGLKPINDTFGHKEGDQALKETAVILKKAFRESDIVARMGGDEFAVFVIDADDDIKRTLTNRLENAITLFNRFEGRTYRLSFSTGVAEYNHENPRSLDELVAEADTFMYENKRRRV